MGKLEKVGLIGKRELLLLVPCSFSNVWEMMRRGEFPLSVKVGKRVFWHRHEVESWLSALPRSQYLAPTTPDTPSSEQTDGQ